MVPKYWSSSIVNPSGFRGYISYVQASLYARSAGDMCNRYQPSAHFFCDVLDFTQASRNTTFSSSHIQKLEYKLKIWLCEWKRTRRATNKVPAPLITTPVPMPPPTTNHTERKKKQLHLTVIFCTLLDSLLPHHHYFPLSFSLPLSASFTKRKRNLASRVNSITFPRGKVNMLDEVEGKGKKRRKYSHNGEFTAPLRRICCRVCTKLFDTLLEQAKFCHGTTLGSICRLAHHEVGLGALGGSGATPTLTRVLIKAYKILAHFVASHLATLFGSTVISCLDAAWLCRTKVSAWCRSPFFMRLVEVDFWLFDCGRTFCWSPPCNRGCNLTFVGNVASVVNLS